MKFNKIVGNSTLFIVILLISTLFYAGAGLCAEQKKVAVIPFTMNSSQDLGFLQNGLFDMLSSRLSDSGKVVVLDREAVDSAMQKAVTSGKIKGTLNESKAKILGQTMGVDYILFGSLNNFGKSVSLDTSMVDISGKRPIMTFFKQSNNMGDVIPMINTFAGDINQKVFNRSIANELYVQPQQPAQAQAPGALQNAGVGQGGYNGGFVNLKQSSAKGFLTHLKFKGEINAMAAGDLNKDGTIEIVTATDYTIYIHKLEGNKLVVENKLDFASTNRIAALDIADINKNGFPEIFVTSINIHREGLQSFVLEYDGKNYNTLTDDERYYFRVIDGDSSADIDINAKILLGQRGGKHPFDGKIFTMAPAGNSYSEQRRLQLPRGVSVLSLAEGSLTSKDAKEHVLINENGRLTIAGGTGSIEWEGTSKFGGTAHYFLLPLNDTDSSYQERIYLNPRIKFYDIEKSGKTQVFAIRNEEIGGGALGRYKRFSKGNLEILSWNGIALSPLFKIRPVQGWISDFAIADFDGDGKDELIISIVGKTKILLNTKQVLSNIISYELE